MYFYDLTNLNIITHISISTNNIKFIFQNFKNRILYGFSPLVNGGIKTYLISLKNYSINTYDNIVDSEINQIIEAQYKINLVFYLYYSELFLFQYSKGF